jgi:putative ABC transport system permease protein
MKTIEVKDQVRLPLSRCVELVLSSMRYRLFRASITVTIISLAGAFLMTILGEGLIARQVAGYIEAHTAPRKALSFWVTRISVPMTSPQLVRELAKAQTGDDRWQEFAAWGRLSDAQLSQLADIARRQVIYEAYFENLGEGQRRPLVGRAQGEEIFTSLQDPARFVTFKEVLRTLLRQLPTPVAELEAFLRDWQAAGELRRTILEGNARSVEGVRKTYPGDFDPQRILAEVDDNLLKTLGTMGFRLSGRDLPVVRDQAQLSLDAKRLAGLLNEPVSDTAVAVQKNAGNNKESTDDSSAAGSRQATKVLVKNLLARRLDVDIASVTVQMFYQEMESAAGSAWLVEQIGKGRLGGLTDNRIRQVAQYALDQGKLETVSVSVSQVAEGEGFMGLNPRTLALIAVSFFVCIVGIANAMLMSVTERFREIATMKCLGATDGFIMINFILESIMQGIAGGVIGVVLGFLLGTLRAWGSYGWMAMANYPVANLTQAAALALGIGVIISALAAVYPAYVAARLAPMEAMRIE